MTTNLSSVRRLSGLVNYNRDWMKYLLARYHAAQPGETSRFRLRNGQIVELFADGRFILNEIYLDRVYDVAGADLATCSRVLDLGANTGVFALYATSMAPNAAVYCFEPDPRNFEVLNRNLKLNQVAGQAYPFAVAGRSGSAYLQAGSSVEHSLSANSADGQKIECVDLSRVFELAGVTRFDFAKIDVEGAELEIFDLCPNDILRRIRAMAVEWHHSVEALQALRERLRKIGFEAEITVLPPNIRYLKARQF
jgi:FkbM family methyltransferase